MASTITSVDEYLASLPEDRQVIMTKLRNLFLNRLPEGFEEAISYGMIGYVVPKSIYPSGYHCDPKLPLPFISMASQKNGISIYHMAMIEDNEVLQWFTHTYPQHCKTKLDMGKSCIRFKKLDDIPYELIGQLAEKMDVKAWIDLYESKIKSK